MNTNNKKDANYEMPVILYEEPSSRGEKAIPFPYIEVLENKTMPQVLFIFEYKHTGETEPDDQGRDAAVIDQIPHKYVDMEYLKEKLPLEINDVVRVALGMKPLKTAQEEGQKILDRVFSKFGQIEDNAKKTKEEKLKELHHQNKKEEKLS